MNENVENGIGGLTLVLIFILFFQGCSTIYTTDDVYNKIDELSRKVEDLSENLGVDTYGSEDISSKIDECNSKIDDISYDVNYIKIYK